MAEANGRYQSRLFKFVYKQSRRFTSYGDRLSGYIQNTASWVAAVGLYPLMLLFQSRRSLAQQIDQAVQQYPQYLGKYGGSGKNAGGEATPHCFPRGRCHTPIFPLSAAETDSEPFCVDTPIQRVLLSIDALSAEPAISTESFYEAQPLKNIFAFFAPWRFDKKINQLEQSWGSWGRQESGGSWGSWGSWGRHPKSKIQNLKSRHPTTNYQSTRFVIQGIATQLTSQTLVLVTAHNEILDILTSTQQEKIQVQILNAVADYWRYQRKLGEKTNQALLGEKNPLSLTLRTVLAFLDRTVAKVETNHLMGVKEVALAPSLNSSLSVHRPAKSGRQLVEQVQTGSGAISQNKSAAINPNSSSTKDTIRIVALIRAAVDYFFGIDKKPIDRTLKSDSHKLNPNFTESASANRHLHSSNSHSQPLRLKGRYQAAKLPWAKSSEAYLSAGSQSVNPGIEDPWLCESDLFGEWVASGKLTDQPQQSSFKTTMSGSRLVPSLGSTKFSLGILVDKWGKFLLQPKPASELVKRQTKRERGKQRKRGKLGEQLSTTVRAHRIAPLPITNLQDTSGKFTQTRSNTDIQPSPDWIETNATVVGYVKHPLEQLLAWLDLAMLWLENILLQIWHWLQSLGARGA